MATDVSRLVLQVDASVELARKNLRDLSRAVETDSASMEKSLARVERSHARMGQQLAKTGQFRGGMQQLSFQIGDVGQQLAQGTDVSRIFIQQSGQVIQAIQLMSAESSGFLRFLGGPWGIALATAGAVLFSFAGKLFETKDAVGELVAKMREQAEQARNQEAANAVWERSLDGVLQKLREVNEEQRKVQTSDRDGKVNELGELEGTRGTANSRLGDVRRDLEAARRQLEQAQRDQAVAQAVAGADGGVGAGIAAGAVRSAQADVTRLAKQFNELTLEVARSDDAVKSLRIQIARLDAKDINDPIGTRFRNLREEAEATIKDVDKLARRLADLDRQEASAREKAKPDRKTSALPKVTHAEGVGLLQDVFGTGTRITSKTRTAAQNKAAGGAANSYHLAKSRGFAIDFVPEGGLARLDKKGDGRAAIQAAADAAGLKILELLGPGDKGHDDHGHVAFAKTRLGPDQVARGQASRARAGQRTIDRTKDQDGEFARQMQQLEEQQLAAQMELVTGIEAQADFARQRVDADQQQFEISVQNAVNDGRLREEQAKLLLEKSEAVALQRKANIDARASIERMEDDLRTIQQESDFRIEGLRYADEIARTQAEHRRIQLQIIEALYAQREADLRIAKAKAEAAQNWEEAARVQRDIDMLPTQRGRDEDRARRETMSPMEQWADGIPQGAEEMSEWFEQLQVDGIMGAVDALAAFSGGWDDMRDTALRALRDIMMQLLRMQLMKAAMSLFGLGGGGGAAPGGDIVVTGLSTNPASIFGAAQGVVGKIGGRGGVDQNMLSINGRPTLRVSAGETLAVIPQGPSVGIPKPANDGGRAPGGGNTYNIHLPPAPNSGDPVRDKATQLQYGSRIRREIARTAERGQ